MQEQVITIKNYAATTPMANGKSTLTQQNQTNVASFERTASVLAGSVLGVYGLRRRPYGLLLTLLGGGLIYRGIKGGIVSIPGVYGGLIDKFPIGAVFWKGLTLKGGQTHVQRYLRPLLDRITAGEIDPSFVITHRLSLEEAPHAYRMFRDKADQCIKVVLKP